MQIFLASKEAKFSCEMGVCKGTKNKKLDFLKITKYDGTPLAELQYI
jgi:hypothetical protein